MWWLKPVIRALAGAGESGIQGQPAWATGDLVSKGPENKANTN